MVLVALLDGFCVDYHLHIFTISGDAILSAFIRRLFDEDYEVFKVIISADDDLLLVFNPTIREKGN
jgi:hypothetical protein